MGSAGTLTDICEILIRHNTLKAVASDLLATERWEINERDPEDVFGNDPVSNCDADIVLRQTSTENEDEFLYLALWSDTAYHLDIDSCITIEVPDVYCLTKSDSLQGCALTKTVHLLLLDRHHNLCRVRAYRENIKVSRHRQRSGDAASHSSTREPNRMPMARLRKKQRTSRM